MARPRSFPTPKKPLERWYVYNWLMKGFDTYSKHTSDDLIFVKNAPMTYAYGALVLGSDGRWCAGRYHGLSQSFRAYSWSEVEGFARGRDVELVDCRRPHP
jgi:hypothetical protein